MSIDKEADDLCTGFCRAMLAAGESLLDCISDAIKGCDPSKVVSYVNKRIEVALYLRDVKEHLESHLRGDFLHGEAGPDKPPMARFN